MKNKSTLVLVGVIWLLITVIQIAVFKGSDNTVVWLVTLAVHVGVNILATATVLLVLAVSAWSFDEEDR